MSFRGLRLSIAGRSDQRQRGQALVIVALSMVVIVGLVGLALDGGHAFVDRRALQSGSDVSSEAGTSLLAYNFHQPAAPKTDPQVSSAIQAQVNSSASSDSQVSPFPGSAAACDPGVLTDPTNVSQVATSLTASCAWYVDGSDQTSTTTQKKLLLWQSGANTGHPVQVGNGQLPPVCPSTAAGWGTHCTDGTSVLAYYTHPTYFLRAIGQTTATERAIATSTFAPVTAVGPTGGLAHYAVWAFCTVPGSDPADGSTGAADGIADAANHPDNPADESPDVDLAGSNEPEVDLNDIVVIRDNKWHSVATSCNPANSNSNNFKGWFHDSVTANPSTGGPFPPATPPPFGFVSCSGNGAGAAKTNFTELDYFCAKGGNSVGNEAPDIALLQNAWDTCHQHTAPCAPVLLPVIDYLDEQNASNYVFHIKSWVAGVPTKDPSSLQPSDSWEVQVVDQVAHRVGWCATPPCPPPPPNAPVSINLVQ